MWKKINERKFLDGTKPYLLSNISNIKTYQALVTQNAAITYRGNLKNVTIIIFKNIFENTSKINKLKYFSTIFASFFKWFTKLRYCNVSLSATPQYNVYFVSQSFVFIFLKSQTINNKVILFIITFYIISQKKNTKSLCTYDMHRKLLLIYFQNLMSKYSKQTAEIFITLTVVFSTISNCKQIPF